MRREEKWRERGSGVFLFWFVVVFFCIDRTAAVGNQRVKRGWRFPAFILSLQIHDLYQQLPETCDDALDHIEQQLAGNRGSAVASLKRRQSGIILPRCVCRGRFTLDADMSLCLGEG